MSETKSMEANKAGGMTRTNRAILIAAFVLLAAAIGYAIWRDSAPSATGSASESVAAPSDQIADLEARARREPDSADAWTALGAAKFDLGDFAGAIAAYEKAVALSSESAGLWSALGEARVMASDSEPMPAAASQAFDKAIALDAKDPRARYFLAVRKDIGGDHRGAIEDWFALLADTPQGAPWEADLRRTIEQVGQIHKIEVADRLAATRPRAATPPQKTPSPRPGKRARPRTIGNRRSEGDHPCQRPFPNQLPVRVCRRRKPHSDSPTTTSCCCPARPTSCRPTWTPPAG